MPQLKGCLINTVAFYVFLPSANVYSNVQLTNISLSYPRHVLLAHILTGHSIFITPWNLIF